jgi:membrane dipeptidase
MSMEEARKLIKDSIVVLAHTDLAASDVDWRRESGDHNVLDRRHAPTLLAGGATVVCDHVGGDWRYGYLPATRLNTDSLQRFMRVLAHTYSEMEESKHFVLAKTVEDIEDAKRDGKIAFLICLEGATPLQNEVSYLHNFYRLGLRCFGLTHDIRNEVADGIRERDGGGLTHFGLTVLKECDRLGIVVDVSHMSDRGTMDVLENGTKPIIASHSNARALCSHKRNLTDEMIKGIAKTGGVIGFHALNRLVSDKPDPTLDDILRHVAYIAEKAGTDCIGVGPDIMENWDDNLVNYISERATTMNGIPVMHWKHGYPKGMSTNAQLPDVVAGMLKMGFSKEDLKKFLGGNFMRVFRQVWKPRGVPERTAPPHRQPLPHYKP